VSLVRADAMKPVTINPKTKVLYDYQFLQIVKIKTETGTCFIVRHLSIDDPSSATHVEQFSLSLQVRQTPVVPQRETRS
jgi:hypothetical protein